MRILQFISSSGFFGAENVVLQLASSLVQLGIDVTVGVVLNTGNPHLELLEECRRRKINALPFTCRGKIDYQLVKNLREFISSERIDILHSHGYKSNIYAWLTSIGLPVGLVSTCHNWIDNDQKMKLYSKLDRFILKKFNQIIAVSSQVAEQLLLSKISSDKVQRINNGIDINVFFDAEPDHRLKSEFGIMEGEVVIGSVGRVSEEKGHRFLLNAFKMLKNSYANVKLIIVGDGPLKAALEEEYSDLDVIFAGNRRDIAEMYQLMDIFVLPSLMEGLPMVLLESMASGKAVVASRVGEIPSVVNDAESGLLVSPESEKELYEALTRLLLSPQFTEKLGQSASSVVRKKFSSLSMGQAYVHVYKKVIRQSNSALSCDV